MSLPTAIASTSREMTRTGHLRVFGRTGVGVVDAILNGRRRLQPEAHSTIGPARAPADATQICSSGRGCAERSRIFTPKVAPERSRNGYRLGISVTELSKPRSGGPIQGMPEMRLTDS